MWKFVRYIMGLVRRTVKTDLIKVFSFTALSTLVRMLTGLVSVKVVAGIIGPAGVALVGQLNNFASIVMALSSGGINSGITKYVAEYKEDNDKIKDCISTAWKIMFVCSFITGLLMIFFHLTLSEYVMLSPDYGYVFVIFGFTVLFYAFNSLLNSILNGFKEFKKYVRINIAGSIIGLVFTLTLVWGWGLQGALVGTVTFQSVMLFVTFRMIRRLPWMKWSFFREEFNHSVSKKYFRYSLMTLTTAAVVPVSQMLLRGYVISEISPVEAGWWEAMNRISNMYLMVVTTSFSVYYLPRLSELTDRMELRREIFRSYKIIVPMLFIGFAIIYLLRFIVVRVLFTPDFLPMENLFLWQLLGDFFKLCSWLLAFLMVAKSMTKMFMLTEVIFSLSFIGFGFLFMHWNGVVGITQGYFVNSVAYMLVMLILFRNLLFLGRQ